MMYTSSSDMDYWGHAPEECTCTKCLQARADQEAQDADYTIGRWLAEDGEDLPDDANCAVVAGFESMCRELADAWCPKRKPCWEPLPPLTDADIPF